MKPIQYSFSLNNFEYYKKHLSIISCLLPTKLTIKEIEVLSAFMSLDKGIIKDDMFNMLSRKLVKQKLGLSSASLSNYLRILLQKKVIDNKGGILVMKSFLIPGDKNQGYQIKIYNEGD